MKPVHSIIVVIFLFEVNDCVRLIEVPQNGSIAVSHYFIEGTAKYGCMPNYRLIPRSSMQRTCSSNGWSESVPACSKLLFFL